jgi:hypothetical protein
MVKYGFCPLARQLEKFVSLLYDDLKMSLAGKNVRFDVESGKAVALKSFNLNTEPETCKSDTAI